MEKGNNATGVLKIVIKTQFTAIHQWSDCPHKEVSFLRNPHRHIFHVTMKWKVTHNDRDKEFIVMKNRVNTFIRNNWDRNFLGNMSCEMMAETLSATFNADFVSVFEDNENGAEYVKI